jgi:hypothetical protein
MLEHTSAPSAIQPLLASNVSKSSDAVHEYLEDSWVVVVVSPGHRLQPYIGSSLIVLHTVFFEDWSNSPILNLASTFLSTLLHDLLDKHSLLVYFEFIVHITLVIADNVFLSFSSPAAFRVPRVDASNRVLLLGNPSTLSGELHGPRSSVWSSGRYGWRFRILDRMNWLFETD